VINGDSFSLARIAKYSCLAVALIPSEPRSTENSTKYTLPEIVTQNDIRVLKCNRSKRTWNLKGSNLFFVKPLGHSLCLLCTEKISDCSLFSSAACCLLTLTDTNPTIRTSTKSLAKVFDGNKLRHYGGLWLLRTWHPVPFLDATDITILLF